MDFFDFNGNGKVDPIDFAIGMQIIDNIKKDEEKKIDTNGNASGTNPPNFDDIFKK